MSAQLALIIATTITSVTTLLVLIFNTLTSNRKTLTDAVTMNRMHWIEEVRSLMYEFIVEYMKPSCSQEKLSRIKAKIDLYIRFDSPAYRVLENELNNCLKHKYEDESQYQDYMEACQKTLNDVWVRIKIEAGMDRKKNRDVVDKVRKSE